MYRRTKDFIKDWAYESSKTTEYFKNITNEVLLKKDHENVRSIARLCWHITITVSEMMNKAGLEISGPDDDSQPPATIQEIIDTFESLSTQLSSQVEANWVDATLVEKIEMYGELWSKGGTLNVLVKHMAHHRGQLSILMRQSGCKVPGVYGPSKEEWAIMHLPPME